MFAVLHRYERDAQRLEDLAQETFVKAWRALDQFDGRAPFEHWLTRIAVRTALDHLRKRKRVQPEIGFDELGDDALDWLCIHVEPNDLPKRFSGASQIHAGPQQIACADTSTEGIRSSPLQRHAWMPHEHCDQAPPMLSVRASRYWQWN